MSVEVYCLGMLVGIVIGMGGMVIVADYFRLDTEDSQPVDKSDDRFSCCVSGYDELWTWFGLSYASFLVLPRVLMHEMPDEWQRTMANLLAVYEDTFDTSDLGFDNVIVQAKMNGKFTKFPDVILNYKRPDKVFIDNQIKIKHLEK